MTRIVFIALAGLALFATAAAAHQNGRGNNQMRGNRQMQQTGYTGGGCLMNSNMVGRGMMNGNLGKMGPGIRGDATPGAQTNNWRKILPTWGRSMTRPLPGSKSGQEH